MQGKHLSRIEKTADNGFFHYLIEKGKINKEQWLKVVKERGKKVGFREALTSLGFSEDEILQCLAEYYYIPPISLQQIEVDKEAVKLVSEEFALRNMVLPFELGTGKFSEKILKIALADPANRRGVENIRVMTGLEIEPYLAHPQEILEGIHRYLTAKYGTENKDFNSEGIWVLEAENEIYNEGIETVRLVNTIICQGIAQKASDIHWEPQEKDLVIRFRIDGRLFFYNTLSMASAENIISRIKIMAKMDVTEHRLPQDGSFAVKIGQRKIDMRVSSLPTVYGEKIVIRILDPLTANRPLHKLGLSTDLEEKLRKFLQENSGMLLVVGPTGSGKTTTLYALLQELNNRELNIVSIEDPVEYRIAGINQVSVNLKTELTFGRGLRSILRQDPDVIMIGEIRDEETARIGITASLTGHLVLSTLHTKTAVEAVSRLIDMGIEPYLITSAINGVLAQRLVLQLCEKCKKPYVLNEDQLKHMPWFNAQEMIYGPKGCSHCRHTGYQGRIGIHELLLFDDEIKEMVLTRRKPAEIERLAKEKGMCLLWEDALKKVKSGLISIDQVLTLGDKRMGLSYF